MTMTKPEDLAEKVIVALIVEAMKEIFKTVKEKASKPRDRPKHLRDKEAE